MTLGVPPDFDLDDAEAKPGWTQSRTGQAITWSGGNDPQGRVRDVLDPRHGAEEGRDRLLQRPRRRPHRQVDHLPGRARRGRARRREDNGARTLGKAALGRRDRRGRLALLGALFVGLYVWLRPPPPVARPGLLSSAAVLLFRQFVNDDLGCASYLVGDSRRRRRGRRRPAVRDRAVPRRGSRRRASGSSACSRRTRTPITSRGTAASRSSTACRSRSIRSPSRSIPFEPLADGQIVARAAP